MKEISLSSRTKSSESDRQQPRLVTPFQLTQMLQNREKTWELIRSINLVTKNNG